jgi:hypothetical protein
MHEIEVRPERSAAEELTETHRARARVHGAASRPVPIWVCVSDALGERRRRGRSVLLRTDIDGPREDENTDDAGREAKFS